MKSAAESRAAVQRSPHLGQAQRWCQQAVNSSQHSSGSGIIFEIQKRLHVFECSLNLLPQAELFFSVGNSLFPQLSTSVIRMLCHFLPEVELFLCWFLIWVLVWKFQLFLIIFLLKVWIILVMYMN